MSSPTSAAAQAAAKRQSGTVKAPPSEATPWLTRSYRHANGQPRTLVLALEKTATWVVYDLPTNGKSGPGWLVDRLPGSEGYPDARALAEEYVDGQQAYRDGKRDQQTCPDPLPRPELVPRRLINADAARARDAANAFTGRGGGQAPQARRAP